MAEHAEALAQLSRLLDDDSLRVASLETARIVANLNLNRLAAALVAEAAASDDVFDRDSAVSYLESRLDFLSMVLSDNDRPILSADLNRRVVDW